MQRKRNFRIDNKSYNFEARTMGLLLCSESPTLQMLWNRSCNFGFVRFLYFLIHIYFQKSTHIYHNVLESQNAIHNICRVRDSERNKKETIVLLSKL